MSDQYRTIQHPAEGLYKEKGSKFIALAFPANQEAMIKAQLADLRKQYHDARHHCFAWRLGADGYRYRFNDDGEPSGSAGKPIYGQIQSRDLTNILVVVIRYFGGTLLGVGGLINAYRSAASDALDQASIVEMKVNIRLKLDFQYAQLNQVMRVIKELGVVVEHQQFDLQCTMTIQVWKRQAKKVTDQFSRIGNCLVAEVI